MMLNNPPLSIGMTPSRGPGAELRQSLRGLANVTNETCIDPHALSESDPVLGAFRLVSGATHPFQPPPMPQTTTDPVAAAALRLRQIALLARCRIRQVKLSGNWWQRMDGSFVAVRDDGGVVALRRGSRGEYQAIDSSTGNQQRVTPAVARELPQYVFEITQSLPAGRLRIGQLFRIGLQSCRVELLTIALVAFANGLVAIVMPLGMGLIVETLIPEAYRGELLAIGLGLLTATVASMALRVVGEIATVRTQTRLAHAVLPATWDRLLALPASFFRRFSAGDLSIRAWGVHEIQQVCVTTAGAAAFLVLPGIFNLVLMFFLGWQMAAWMLIILLAVGMVTAILCRFELDRRRNIMALEGGLSSQVLEMLSAMTKLKAAGAQIRAYTRWAVVFGTLKSAIFRVQRLSTFFAVVASGVPTLAKLAVIALFVRHACPRMTLGDFVSFNFAFGIVISTAFSAAAMAMAITRLIPQADRIRPLLDAIPESADELPPTNTLSGEIEMSHLSFRYGPHSPLALDDVSLSIRPGEFVAIVGPSGSGKSTLLRVLLGLEEQYAGSIRFDGRNSRLLDLPSLRQQIGTVVQNGKVLAGSILQIVSGQATLSPERAADLVERVGLSADVGSMPMGLFTHINEGGTSLSGGQRQQLLLARALASAPRILLLDEATSALDNVSQLKVIEAINGCRVTRLVVAHRTSTIRNADRIVVLESGRIVQTGTFDQLANQPGLFADLMRRQAS